jgi:hypothetical protein
MAVMMNASSSKFLQKVLANHPSALGKATTLINTGYKLDIQLYLITLETPTGAGYTFSSKVTTSTMMKATPTTSSSVTLSELNRFANTVEDWYDLLGLGGVPSEHTPTAQDAAHASIPAPSVPKATPPPKSPQAGVVKLKDATELGQKVFGTSDGSTYIVVAANDRVKLAVRDHGNVLSLRAEVNNCTSEEMAAIKSMMVWKSHGEYGSVHIKCSSFPKSKVLGSFIFGMGIQFDRVVKPGVAVV